MSQTSFLWAFPRSRKGSIPGRMSCLKPKETSWRQQGFQQNN